MTLTNQTETKTPLYWAQKTCDTLMGRFTAPELPPASRWHYHQGVFLCGMDLVYNETNDQKYFDYYKAYVDHLIDENGNFLFARDELDSIQAGLLLFPLYKATGEKKYQIAAEKLRDLFNTLNLTSEGGFWHKDKYPYQMWLDGLYMGGPFALHYANDFNEPELIDMVIHQEKLMRKHTVNEENGLYHHGWDEKAVQPWSLPNGKAPEIWGRALGWYGLAVIDMIDLLPEDHPQKADWITFIQDYVTNLVKYQDKETGLWYQIIDKIDREDNWLETSASSLFVYVIAKAVSKNYVGKEFAKYAEHGFNGIIEHKVEESESGDITLKDIVIGTSIGVYDYYITRERSENDLHGAGAFIMACMEMEKLVGGE
ncbi:glycoside hydrolase family 88 protein [Bacillus sp. FJAT-50079]|uniref:glycoside hydrolase family 88/105 protein n=1 Tax=Bacillus sp. FJAT-50079 TaxID=2833577 RepID=UPI001BCA419F|nr:glycoside hydrolase family 88 protein [Bacillus sp. FJAT-50079]MBS4207841.1 glycoside hydrolase family 88 protein [Bacillus sp. FJAT-50079]